MSANYCNLTRPKSNCHELDEQRTMTTRAHGQPPEREHFEVRIRIHHDTSYASQSRARAEVWSPATLSWNEIASYAWPEWAHDTEAGDGATVGLWGAHGELLARASHLLGGAA